jgi:hypothetical protein
VNINRTPAKSCRMNEMIDRPAAAVVVPSTTTTICVCIQVLEAILRVVAMIALPFRSLHLLVRGLSVQVRTAEQKHS